MTKTLTMRALPWITAALAAAGLMLLAPIHHRADSHEGKGLCHSHHGGPVHCHASISGSEYEALRAKFGGHRQ